MYPLIIAMIAPALIKERLPTKRWWLILAGFVGVMIVIRPGLPGFHWATLLVVAGTFTYSLFSITTRMLATTEPMRTTNIYTAIVGSIIMLPSLALLGGDWVAPDGLWVWFLAIFMGMAFGGLGHISLLHAHRIIPAPELAPWVYVEMVWVTAAGYVFFSELPDRFAVIGCLIVIAASLVMFRMEHKTARQLVKAQTSSPHD